MKRILPDVFASESDGAVWWTTPHPLLNGGAPRDVTGTVGGLDRVRQLLVALRVGGVA